MQFQRAIRVVLLLVLPKGTLIKINEPNEYLLRKDIRSIGYEYIFFILNTFKESVPNLAILNSKNYSLKIETLRKKP